MRPIPTHMRRGACQLCGRKCDICPTPCSPRLLSAAYDARAARGCPHCRGTLRWLVVLTAEHDRPLTAEEKAKMVVAA